MGATALTLPKTKKNTNGQPLHDCCVQVHDSIAEVRGTVQQPLEVGVTAGDNNHYSKTKGRAGISTDAGKAHDVINIVSSSDNGNPSGKANNSSNDNGNSSSNGKVIDNSSIVDPAANENSKKKQVQREGGRVVEKGDKAGGRGRGGKGDSQTKKGLDLEHFSLVWRQVKN